MRPKPSDPKLEEEIDVPSLIMEKILLRTGKVAYAIIRNMALARPGAPN